MLHTHIPGVLLAAGLVVKLCVMREVRPRAGCVCCDPNWDMGPSMTNPDTPASPVLQPADNLTVWSNQSV